MNKRALAFGIGASLLLAAGAANAGTCSGEIEQLSQSLGVPSDSPNANAGGTANTGVQQPGGGGSDTLAQSDSSSSSSSSTLPSPTVTETSRAGEMNTSAGGRASALVALEKARNFDEAGQEEACMTEIGNAKQQLGIQ